MDISPMDEMILLFSLFYFSTLFIFCILIYQHLPVNLCLQWGSAYPYRMLKIPATQLFYIQPRPKSRKSHSASNNSNSRNSSNYLISSDRHKRVGPRRESSVEEPALGEVGEKCRSRKETRHQAHARKAPNEFNFLSKDSEFLDV